MAPQPVSIPSPITSASDADGLADRRSTALKSLTKTLAGPNSGLRGHAFLKYITEEHREAGKSFYDDLVRLLRKCTSPRQAIRILNMMVLRRVANAAVEDYARWGLKPQDVTRAYEFVEENRGKSVPIDAVEGVVLQKLGFTFGESGILIKREYKGETFPSFPGEPILHKEEVIVALPVDSPTSPPQSTTLPPPSAIMEPEVCPST